nr:wnt inhibitory factor 1-like [Penaeus vannamei]
MCTSRCLHGGVCTAVNRCTCPPGYTGARCEAAICTPACQHGGRCVAPGVCSCPAGYGGPLCQRPVCRPHCQNGGECLAPYRCRCPPGTFGSYCQHCESVFLICIFDLSSVTQSECGVAALCHALTWALEGVGCAHGLHRDLPARRPCVNPPMQQRGNCVSTVSVPWP